MSISKIIKDKKTVLFIVLGCFFITNAVIAEFIGVKIFSLEASLGFEPFQFNFFGVSDLGLNLTAGVVLWPVVFIMTDIINEYFGVKGIRFLSYLAVILIVYAFIVVYAAIELVPNEWWQHESGNAAGIHDMDIAFRAIFGQGLWIIVGSLVAFLVGQFVDVFLFQWIKRITGDKKVWLRATGSTLVSQFIDSYIVLIIAFYIGADWELSRVLAIGTVNYIYKFIVAVGLTPIIYLAHNFIDKYLGLSLASKLKKESML